MSEKIRDLAVKVGTYRDGGGNEKARWKNVGAIMRNDQGREYVLLDRSFNPAGVPETDGRESVLLSAFPTGNQNGGGRQQSGGQQSAPPDPTPGPDGDDIPF